MSDAPHLAEVVSLYETNVRDVPAKLRQTADDIEAGRYGAVGEVALVLLGDTMEVFGWGEVQDGGSSALLLQAGAQRLINMVEQHGKKT